MGNFLHFACQNRIYDNDSSSELFSVYGSSVLIMPKGAASEGSTISEAIPSSLDSSDSSPRPRIEPRRLLLTSGGLTSPTFLKALDELFKSRRPLPDYKVAYITDATMREGDDLKDSVERIYNLMRPLGVVEVRQVTLRNCPHEILARHLDGIDCVYLELGNTFYLRYQMRASGFDELIQPLIRDKGVILVGASAGSIVAGRSVSTALWKGWDDPGIGQDWDLSISYGYGGLDLLPTGESVFPHYGPQYKELVEDRRSTLDHGVMKLDEEHAYFCNGIRFGIIP